MRYPTTLLLVLSFLCFPAQTEAQRVPVAPIQRTIAEQTITKASIAAQAQQSNLALYRQISVLLAPPRIQTKRPIYRLPLVANKPITFRVQNGEKAFPLATASAFAVEIDGHLFGVTAGHVMHNISQNPYMYFQTQEGDFATEKITSWRVSNLMGTDVAVFEIPPQAQSYVQPLPLSEQRAQPLQVSSIAGFSLNKPLWLTREEILLATSHRILIRNNFQKDNTGMCGSPVMVDGKVAGLYVGAFPRGIPSSVLWLKLLQGVDPQSIPPLHLAAPIENIFPLVHDLLGKDVQHEGILMKVLGHPIAVLHPQDELYSVMLLRNGETQSIIRAKELTDPEHLEQFLELQENDILRLTIFPSHSVSNQSIIHYEINVSSGQVVEPKNNF